MSQDFSNKAASIYTRLLTRYGKTAHLQLKRLTGETFDDSAGSRTSTGTSTLTLVGVAGPLGGKLIDESRIREDQGVVFVDGATQPETDDKLLIGGIEKSIVDDGITELNMADVPVGYAIVYKK